MPSNNKTNQQVRRTQVINHRFISCRDVLLANGTGAVTNTAFVMTSNGSGNGSGSFVLAPFGLAGATINAAGLTYDAPTFGNIATPPLRGLYNRALDFQWYRVTRAKLVFASALGSTAIGQLTIAGYADPMDVSSNTTAATNSSANTRTFDLGSGAVKELSVPIPVDTSWKKCTAFLTTRGSTSPFSGGATSLVPVATVGDLAFGGVSWYLASATPSLGNVGSLFVDYDVEFRGPIDSSINA